MFNFISDDRTVSKQNPMMSDTVRDKIAESMKLSKTPISTKRARELMIHPAASKTGTGAGQGEGFTDRSVQKFVRDSSFHVARIS